jgi:hypothetical protein
MQSVPITTNVMSSNLAQAIQHYVIKFASDLWQVRVFFFALRLPPPIHLPPRYSWTFLKVMLCDSCCSIFSFLCSCFLDHCLSFFPFSIVLPVFDLWLPITLLASTNIFFYLLTYSCTTILSQLSNLFHCSIYATLFFVGLFHSNAGTNIIYNFS